MKPKQPPFKVTPKGSAASEAQEPVAATKAKAPVKPSVKAPQVPLQQSLANRLAK